MDGTRSQFSLNERWQKVVLAAGFFSIALGLLALVGWHAGIVAFVQIHPTLAPLQYNTAICFALSGAALYAFARYRHRFTLITGLIVSTLAGLTVIEYLFDVRLGLDRFFISNDSVASLPRPERMPPVSAVCFLQVGNALTLIGFTTTTRLRPLVMGLLGSVVIALGVTAPAGVATIGLGILGLGIAVIGWNEGCRPGEPVPRWLPLPIALSIFTASLMFWQALESRQTRQMAQTINANTADVRNRIIASMNARIELLGHMAQRWEFGGGTPRPAWEADARNCVAGFPGFQAIEWVDPSNQIRWVVPRKGNEQVLNLDLTEEGRRRTALAAARNGQRTTLTPPVHLFEGGQGFLVNVPLCRGTNFDGYIVGVFRAQELFDALLPPDIAAGNSITLQHGNEMIGQRTPSPPPKEQQWVGSAVIPLPDVTWKLRVWPTPEQLAKLKSSLPLAALITGCLASGLFALTVFLAQTAFARGRELAGIHRELRREMEGRQKVEREMERLIAELEEAMAHVKILSGLLPICARCKKIRDDNGYWSQIETYISQHSSASFTHSLCPDCAVITLKEAGIEASPGAFRPAQPPDQA